MLQCVCALGLLDPTLGCLILRLFGGKVQPRGGGGGWGRDCLSEAIKQLAGCQVRAQKSMAMHCRWSRERHMAALQWQNWNSGVLNRDNNPPLFHISGKLFADLSYTISAWADNERLKERTLSEKAVVRITAQSIKRWYKEIRAALTIKRFLRKCFWSLKVWFNDQNHCWQLQRDKNLIWSERRGAEGETPVHLNSTTDFWSTECL